MLLLLALLQQGAPTVGDTIWLVRTVAVPRGSAVRPASWNPAGDLETLGPPRITPRGDSVDIAYPVVVWLAGSRTVDVPGPLLLLAGGGVDSIPAERMTVTVASILPAGVPDSLLQIQPASQPVVRGERTVRPLLLLVLLTGLLLLPVHLLWRRRGKSPARAAPPPVPALPLERWADAGEVRIVLAAATSLLREAIARAVPEATPAIDLPQLLVAVRASRPEWPHDEIADVLGALEEARFTPEAFPDAAGLATWARTLAAQLTRAAA
jgi:hypothetical protein